MATSTPSRTMTAEELLLLPTGMGTLYELVEGELKTMSPAGSRHGRIALRVGSLLHHHVHSHGLGETVGAETGFILRRNPDTVRAPDAAFIAKERMPVGGLPDGYFQGAPDMAVEVVSPSDSAEEIHRKVSEYFKAGTRLLWIIYPKDREVAVFRSARESIVLTTADMLDGGTLLPGFACPVAELFE
jgi:Uma2 family endonuclease